MKRSKCVFPGSFNPFTLGHRRLVELALGRYRRVTVAVADVTYKNDMRPAEIRMKIAVESLADLPSVDVKCFRGMLTDFLAEERCFDVVRGIRNEKDAAYENELARVYTSMDERVNVVRILSDCEDISADLVRSRLASRGDISDLVCAAAEEDIKKYYE